MSSRHEEKYRIVLDLDRGRIKEILREAYKSCRDLLSVEFLVSEDDFVSKIDPYLDSNRVSTDIRIPLPCPEHREMLIELDPRSKKVMVRLVNRKLQARLNHFLGSLR